jgi:tRNA threonylcarbamoyl adenosine modification protein YeaZ
MILAIRTDKPEAELYLLENNQAVAEIKWEAHRELADTLLIKIKELLESKNITNNYIKGIIIHTGEGSFTGLRIGTTVANAMAYSLNIPIISTEGEEWIGLGVENIKSAKAGDLVMPKYNSEPNITKPKGS